jgi:DNA sulfur modification protein DndC
MIGYHTNDSDRYKELKAFKTLLVGMANTTGLRSRIRRNGTVGTGPFLVTVRRKLFLRLKQAEAKTGWTLITPEEESLILGHWEIDEHVHNVPDPRQPVLFGVGS